VRLVAADQVAVGAWRRDLLLLSRRHESGEQGGVVEEAKRSEKMVVAIHGVINWASSSVWFHPFSGLNSIGLWSFQFSMLFSAWGVWRVRTWAFPFTFLWVVSVFWLIWVWFSLIFSVLYLFRNRLILFACSLKFLSPENC
jgi:hypothetical protein